MTEFRNKYPGTMPIYKKSGAAQFTLMEPKYDENGRVTKNGGILLEVAASKGDNDKTYDWGTKISFAFGTSDLCQLFENPDSPSKLIHSSPNGSTKSLEFQPGTGKYAGTYMMNVGEKSTSGDFRKVNVPLSSGEYTVLLRLFMSAAPLIIGWH